MPLDVSPFLAPTNYPTAAGALEFSPAFQQAARDAWSRTGAGLDRAKEAGFSVDSYGHPFGTVFNYDPRQTDNRDRLSQQNTPDTLTLLHTHNNFANGQPSPADIQEAQRIHKLIYVLSREGLYAATPDGHVQQVFHGTDWMGEDAYASEIQARYAAKTSGKPVRLKTKDGIYTVDPLGNLTKN